MKKILAFAAAAIITAAGCFALDLGDIQGKWKDTKYDGTWNFRADGHIVLSETSTGKQIYDFNDSNVTKFKIEATTEGVSISFYCKDTQRFYKFTKPLTLNADLTMFIDPDWTTTDYNTTIKFSF